MRLTILTHNMRGEAIEPRLALVDDDGYETSSIPLKVLRDFLNNQPPTDPLRGEAASLRLSLENTQALYADLHHNYETVVAQREAMKRILGEIRDAANILAFHSWHDNGGREKISKALYP